MSKECSYLFEKKKKERMNKRNWSLIFKNSILNLFTRQDDNFYRYQQTRALPELYRLHTRDMAI